MSVPHDLGTKYKSTLPFTSTMLGSSGRRYALTHLFESHCQQLRGREKEKEREGTCKGSREEEKGDDKVQKRARNGVCGWGTKDEEGKGREGA